MGMKSNTSKEIHLLENLAKPWVANKSENVKKKKKQKKEVVQNTQRLFNCFSTQQLVSAFWGISATLLA